MDLFELFANKPKIDFSPEEALMMVAMCASASDNKPSQEEINRIVSLAMGHPMFHEEDVDTLNRKVDRMLHLLLKLGISKSIELARKPLTPELKETAFAWAVYVVFADGWIDDGEKHFLENLMSQFNIDNDVAKKIIEVTQIINRT